MNRYSSMLKELLDVDSGLSDWEIEFLDSLVGQGYLREDDVKYITKKQSEKLESIWNKIFK